uniref:Uncharacterized protein n=1 Tax=Romanomermis culicivorax TaxID=13658 RepID=A0A915J9M0_ROMCU
MADTAIAGAKTAMNTNDAVMPKKGKEIPLKIFHRFHFSSNLKRMSVIAGYIPVGTSDVVYLATVKGAPETLKTMFAEVPQNYDAIYQQMTREGARVIALGYKELGTLTHKQIREMKRDDVECGLHFAGFVVISCPLKSDSKAMIKEIIASSHQPDGGKQPSTTEVGVMVVDIHLYN